MAARDLMVALNGARLIEAELYLGTGIGVIARMYTVKSPATPKPTYQGENFELAKKAFAEAAKAKGLS